MSIDGLFFSFIEKFCVSLRLVKSAMMKYLNIETMAKVTSCIRRYISPAYIMMFVAAFVLWYITKLGDTYTTNHKVTVVIDGESYTVDCIIRGKGTDLIGYTLSSRRSRFSVSSSELTYELIPSDSVDMRHVSTVSLRQALAARMGDIEVVAVGSIPPSVIKRSERSSGDIAPQPADNETIPVEVYPDDNSKGRQYKGKIGNPDTPNFELNTNGRKY